ncbi:hypothetical protein [Conexibacter sp. CPCC 206217]|uniref:hypothetical protein n=1 Tax=Conexibacter sp. CPCC 206217 TaxID=3064574 RepID=UPI00271B6A5A|nr:hypothetical protein [Conexibacter sp. CPCC 206217]MDO8213006.1 hypothetical protein [Conexibacter sp. CPCC 206217]
MLTVRLASAVLVQVPLRVVAGPMAGLLAVMLLAPLAIVPVRVPEYRHAPPRMLVIRMPTLTLTTPLFMSTVIGVSALALVMAPEQPLIVTPVTEPEAPFALPTSVPVRADSLQFEVPRIVLDVNAPPSVVLKLYGSGLMAAEAEPPSAANDAAAIAATIRPRLKTFMR